MTVHGTSPSSTQYFSSNYQYSIIYRNISGLHFFPKILPKYERRTCVIGNFTSFYELMFQKLSLLVSKYVEDIKINLSNEQKAITLTIKIVRILVPCISVQSTLLLCDFHSLILVYSEIAQSLCWMHLKMELR